MFDRFFDSNVEFIKAMLLTTACCLLVLFYVIEKYKWNEQIKNVAERILEILAAFSVLALLNMGFMHYKGGFFHGHEFFNNYMTAKYFKEVGYSYLADAAITADNEGRKYFKDVKHIRDQESFELIPVEKIPERKNKWRENFSEKRWQKFKNDLEFFQNKPGVRTFAGYPLSLSWWNWSSILTDNSYKASPLWIGVSRILTNIIPATAMGVFLLSLLDLVLLGAITFCLMWGFGKNIAMFSLILFCNMAVPYFSWVGGALLQLEWLALLVAGVAMLKMDRHFYSGGFIALSGLTRMFPFVFIIPVAAKAIINFVRKKKVDDIVIPFTKGFLLTIIAGFLFTMIVVPSPLASWAEYFAGAMKRAQQLELAKMGFKDVFMWEGEVREFLKPNWRDLKAERLTALYPLMFIIQCIGVYTLYLYIQNKNSRYWESMIFGGCLLLFLFFTFSKVYYVYLILLVPWLLTEEKNKWLITGTILLFTMNILMFLLDTFQSTTFLIKFCYMAMLGLVFGYILYYNIEIKNKKN